MLCWQWANGLVQIGRSGRNRNRRREIEARKGGWVGLSGLRRARVHWSRRVRLVFTGRPLWRANVSEGTAGWLRAAMARTRDFPL